MAHKDVGDAAGDRDEDTLPGQGDDHEDPQAAAHDNDHDDAGDKGDHEDDDHDDDQPPGHAPETLTCTSGDDHLHGGAGDDSLVGGAGDDLLRGAATATTRSTAGPETTPWWAVQAPTC